MQSNRPTPAHETAYTETYPNGNLRGTSVRVRLMRRVVEVDGCWIWQGAKRPSGYGLIGVNQHGKQTVKSTHRVSYELFVGRIPSGMHVDHLCSTRECVNPKHLRAVTQAENNQAMWERGERPKATHCVHGHEFTPENTAIHSSGSGRQCRTCRTVRSRAARAKAKANENR